MADFDPATIEIGYYTDNWGPYSFRFPAATSLESNDGIIPYGTTITAVTVKGYEGNVSRKSDLSSETEITDIIDADYPPTITGANSDTVTVRFFYPTAQNFKGQKATIVFELTLSNAAKKSFYFKYVRIQ